MMVLPTASLLQATCGGIYKITNRVNGKTYVGSAVSFRRRWAKHLCELRAGKHANSHLQRSWNNHGEVAFALAVLEHCEVADLISREQHWIDELKPAYNVRTIAESNRGVKRTPAQCARLSERMREYWKHPEHRKRLSEAKKGKRSSPQTEFKKGERPSPQTGFKNGQTAWNKGRKTGPQSEELKRKRADGLKLIWAGRSAERRAAIGETIRQKRIANKSYGHSEETKRKISESQKKAVDQYDLEGRFIRTFDSCIEAKAATGAQHIGKVCDLKRMTSGGFVWHFHEGRGVLLRHASS